MKETTTISYTTANRGEASTQRPEKQHGNIGSILISPLAGGDRFADTHRYNGELYAHRSVGP